jgi:hypothetical protein
MSNSSTAIAWHHSNAPTRTTKLVLLKIADMDGDGGAWPSMDTLAKSAMVGREAARKAVRQLEDLGEIKTHINEGGGIRTQKHMRTNVYEFLLGCPWYCDGTSSHKDLRDENNSRLRPGNWSEIVIFHTDQTPPPQGGDPSPERGGPPPQEGANHNLTTPIDQDINLQLSLLDVRENENPISSSVNRSGYDDWSPGEKVAQAAAKVAKAKPVKRPDLSKGTRPAGGVAPAPVIPRYHAESMPRPRATLSAEDATRQAIARTLPCPRGIADASHTMPGLSLMCTRCGTEADELEL